ncbi:MAG: hypothetical protein K0U84_00690 [Actinomycetia bacterium]|nr:hypothetical protein [Actinomycetes bacterium]
MNYLPGFDNGYDAVLLTLDGGGLAALLAPLREAIATSGAARVDTGGVTHDFAISANPAAALTLQPHRVTWQLDRAKADEVAAGLTVLHDSGSAGHIYVDLQYPAPILVISRDEYVHVAYPWVDPPGGHALA